ncbi:GyrI-like domain-containing protein [Chitinophaga varians]|uniref:GyrI-like domain-containing protein n=1 Tax=Chitinophaga varians TaxID=2202339 RepID=UPI001CB715BD|nr:GyrI-like domain-containing protein [Chitinophaga varians]
MEKMEQFAIIGIAVRTTNENEQATQDIPALWNRFFSEKVAEHIPGKTDDTVYCVYTDYEKDHTQPYTVILGCRVPDLDHIPDGMTGKMIPAATYSKHTAKGNLAENVIYHEWIKIIQAGLPRTFTADFEVYGEKAMNPAAVEVDIFIAVKQP